MGSRNIMCILYIVRERAVPVRHSIRETSSTRARQILRRQGRPQGTDKTVSRISKERRRALRTRMLPGHPGSQYQHSMAQEKQTKGSTQAARTTRTEAIYGKDDGFEVIGLDAITKHKHDRAMMDGSFETGRLCRQVGRVRTEFFIPVTPVAAAPFRLSSPSRSPVDCIKGTRPSRWPRECQR